MWSADVTVETVPANRYTGVLLQIGDSQRFARDATSSAAMEFAHNVIRRLPITWEQLPLSAHELDNLAELILRLIVSFLEHPPEPPCTDTELRDFLRPVFRPMLTQRTNSVPVQSLSPQK